MAAYPQLQVRAKNAERPVGCIHIVHSDRLQAKQKNIYGNDSFGDTLLCKNKNVFIVLFGENIMLFRVKMDLNVKSWKIESRILF